MSPTVVRVRPVIVPRQPLRGFGQPAGADVATLGALGLGVAALAAAALGGIVWYAFREDEERRAPVKHGHRSEYALSSASKPASDAPRRVSEKPEKREGDLRAMFFHPERHKGREAAYKDGFHEGEKDVEYARARRFKRTSKGYQALTSFDSDEPKTVTRKSDPALYAFRAGYDDGFAFRGMAG